MKENTQASIEMRLRALEQDVRQIQEQLRDLTVAKPQRDTSGSPRPQRDATNFVRNRPGYRTEPDENPFAQAEDDGPFGPPRR